MKTNNLKIFQNNNNKKNLILRILLKYCQWNKCTSIDKNSEGSFTIVREEDPSNIYDPTF